MCRCADIVVWFGCIQVGTFAICLMVGVSVGMVSTVVVGAVCPSGPVFARIILPVEVVCSVVVSSLAASVVLLVGMPGT